MAAVVSAALVAAGNFAGLLPTPWDLWKVHFFGAETGLGNSYLALLGDGRNPALALVAGLVAWLLLPRERSYRAALAACGWVNPPEQEIVKKKRETPDFPVAIMAAVPLPILFLPALVGGMGHWGSMFDAGWWVVAGAACVVVPVVVPAAIGVAFGHMRPWDDLRFSLWTAASMAVLGATLVGLYFTGWAALAVLAGALVAASPRWIVPPVLWGLRKIFPPRAELPKEEPILLK